MANQTTNRLETGSTYRAFCHSEHVAYFNFTFDGDIQSLVQALHERFSLAERRHIALDCGNREIDEERHSGNFWWSDLATLQESNFEFGVAERTCLEEYGGEELIVIERVAA